MGSKRPAIGCWTLDVGRRAFPIFFSIAVPSLFGQSDSKPADNSSKLLPPYGELPPTFWEQHGIAIILAAIVLVVVAAFVVWLCVRPKPFVPEPPEVRARRELNVLLNKSEDGALLSKVSQTLRRYVVTRFGLSSGELTTTEFRDALKTNDKSDAPLTSELLSFLDECDRRKFAPQSFSQPMDAAVRALQLVGACENRLAQISAAPEQSKLSTPANA